MIFHWHEAVFVGANVFTGIIPLLPPAMKQVLDCELFTCAVICIKCAVSARSGWGARMPHPAGAMTIEALPTVCVSFVAVSFDESSSSAMAN